MRARHLFPLICAAALAAAGPVAARAVPAAVDSVAATAPAVAAAFPGAPQLLLFVFALLIFLPFVSGLIEVYAPRDRYPLPVNIHYVKDPRYLGKSSRRLFAEAMARIGDEDGVSGLILSRDETARIEHDLDVPEKTRIEHVLAVRGDLKTAAFCRLVRDAWSGGDAAIGEGGALRTLVCGGDMVLADEVIVQRWVDCEGDLRVGAGCRLGHSATAGGRLDLGAGVRFSRLFGAPVAGPDYAGDRDPGTAPVAPPPPDEVRTIADVLDYHAKGLALASGAVAAAPMVVRGDLDCGEGCVLAGPVRTHGAVKLGAGCTVHGDIFAEGSVELGPDVLVLGNVFSQDRVTLRSGARIGHPGAVRSLIGKRSIRLAADSAVHGYVLTEGEGVVK